MNSVAVWDILKWSIGGAALVFALGAAVLMWRIRGIFNWQVSLKQELVQLERQQSSGHQRRSDAIAVVVDRCRKIRGALSPGFDELLDIHDFIRSIAACYHPGHPSPEMKIPVGRLIRASAALSERLQLTLNRVFFKRLKHLRIRHLHQAYDWYKAVMGSAVVVPLWRISLFIRQMLRVLRWIFFDPISWVTYLSGRLSMLIMARTLLLDVYLYLGKLAVDAYDARMDSDPEAVQMEEPEEGLKLMAGLREPAINIMDPRIRAIRDDLVGFPARLMNPPRIRELKTAIGKSAEILAGRYFPDADMPLEEAALGPVLERTGEWLDAIAQLEKYRLIQYIYHIPLETVYSASTISRLLKSSPAALAAKRALSVYKWMKWPLKLYRWSRKTAPAAISISIGWELSKKAALNFFCRYLFDRANREIDRLYCQSCIKDLSSGNKCASDSGP